MINLIKMIREHGLFVRRCRLKINGKDMNIKGMVLYMNRNTRTTNGYYYVDVIEREDKGIHRDNEKRYPVKMVDNKIIPTKEIKDEKIKKEIENFKFFVQIWRL